MFDALALIDRAPGLNLPDDYEMAPLINLMQSAYQAGADAGADDTDHSVEILLSALKKIVLTTTDPAAKAVANQALEIMEGLA